MNYGRKYGDRDSHPIYLWNGILEPKHLKRLGPAFSLFVWLIDRTTKEQDGIGAVLGGMPLKAEEIGISMGVCEKTILRRLDRLDRHVFIERTLTPHGYIIKVRKSCKFPKRSSEVGQKCPTTQETGRTEVSDHVGQDCPTYQDRSVRPNKSKQLEKAVEEASRAAVWSFLGVDGSRFKPDVREICAKLYGAKNGETPAEFIGACMDGIQALRLNIPPTLAQRAAVLRTQPAAIARAPIPEVEAEPWGAGSGVKQ